MHLLQVLQSMKQFQLLVRLCLNSYYQSFQMDLVFSYIVASFHLVSIPRPSVFTELESFW